MSDPLSILGFYFTLIGFIAGIFFTRLDSWYNEVRAKSALIDSRKTTGKLLDLKDDFTELTSSEPLVSFLAIGIFLAALAVLSLFVPASAGAVNIVLFLYAPLWVTVSAYWIGGITLLAKARKLTSRSMETIRSRTGSHQDNVHQG